MHLGVVDALGLLERFVLGTHEENLFLSVVDFVLLLFYLLV